MRQPVALGLGHAVLCAAPVVGNEPFAVILPDVLIDKYHADARIHNLKAMIQRFETTGASQIMVEPVPALEVNKYGIVDISGEQLVQGQSALIRTMVEKPEIEDAPSNLAITGRYVLSAKVWDLLRHTAPGAGGEIQLTDALHHLLLVEQIEAYHLQGKSHDCGSKIGYLKAVVEYALQDKKLSDEFRSYLKNLHLLKD